MKESKLMPADKMNNKVPRRNTIAGLVGTDGEDNKENWF